MEIKSPSGRIYQWDKPEPPTKEDFDQLVAFDAAQPPLEKAKMSDSERKVIGDSISDAVSMVSGLPAPLVKAALTKGGAVGDVAASVVLPLAGAALGGISGGPLGAAAGGSGASAASDALVQAREMLRGERTDFSGPSVVASGLVGGIIPPEVKSAATPLKTLLKTIAVRGAQGAGLGAAHEGIRQTLSDEPYDIGQIAQAGAMGAPFGAGFGAVEAVGPRVGTALKNVINTFKAPESIIPSIESGMSAPNPGAANAAANQIALGKPAGAPSAVGSPELPLDIPEDVQATERYVRSKKAEPTPKATPIQKQIEETLGIFPEEVKANVEARKEAESAIKQADDFIANQQKLQEVTPGRFGSGGKEEQNVIPYPEKAKAGSASAENSLLGGILKENAATATGKPDTALGPIVEDLIGQKVRYEGEEGVLIKNDDGTLGVMQEVRKSGEPIRVREVSGYDKQAPEHLATDLGIVPVLISPKGIGNALESPSPRLSDYEQYQETQRRFAEFNAKGDNNSPEFIANWKKNEEIKNRHGGMPPQKGESGFINPAVAAHTAAPAAGAAIGYQFGDTPDEKRKNAILGALMASGGSLAVHSGVALQKYNPALLGRLKAAGVAFKEGLINNSEIGGKASIEPGLPVAESSVESINPNAVQVTSPEGVSLSSSSGNSQEVGQEIRGRGKPADARSPSDGERAPTNDEALQENVSETPQERVVSQDAPNEQLANISPRYEWSPFLSKTSVGKALKQVLGTVEGNIMAVSPRVGGAIRSYMGMIDELRAEWQPTTQTFGHLARKSLTPDEFKNLNWAIWSQKHDDAIKLLSNKPNGPELVKAFTDAKATYENMAKAQESVGREVDRITDAWPRQMIDYNEFRKTLDLQELGTLEKAIATAEKAKKRPLNEDEKAEVINNAISLSIQGKPTFLKARTVQGLTPDQVMKAYEPFDVAMDNRINRVSTDIAKRKFLGKESPEDARLWDGRTGDFGSIINDEISNGKISDEGQRVIRSNIRDLLHTEGGAENWVMQLGNKVARWQNFLFLGDISTSIGQFGDIFLNLLTFGPKATASGYLKRPIKLKDLGLGSDTFAEIQALSHAAENTKTRRFANSTIRRMIGVADTVNKEAAANAARVYFIKSLKDKGSRNFLELNERYSKMFPERWPSMLRDLEGKPFAEGKLNENTRFFIYNELANLQPLTMAQRAQFENSTPAARLAYSLKRYWIKQVDVLRQSGYEQLKKPGLYNKVDGLAYIAAYATLVGLGQGIAVSTMRDIMAGRDVDVGENAIQGLAQLSGFSRHNLEDLRTTGPGGAIGSWISPLSGVVRDAYKDYADVINGKPLENLRAVKYVPYVGRELYNLAGGGVEAKQKAQKLEEQRLKRIQQTGQGVASPTLDELLKTIHPRSPQKKR